MGEDLGLTLQRFEYFIQVVLRNYREPPLLLVMFKEGRDVKIVTPVSDNIGDFKLFYAACIKSFKPDQNFINIPCTDEKYDSILSMKHKGSDIIRQWGHIKNKPLDQDWEGVITYG